MNFVIDDVDFKELDSERYWSFPKSYKKDPKIEVRNMIFSGTYLGARKMDGAYFRFIKGMDGGMRLQGRSRGVSGDYLDKIDHVPHLMDFFNWLPNGTCLLGEIYFPDKEGSNEITKIMGCLPKKAIERQKIIQSIIMFLIFGLMMEIVILMYPQLVGLIVLNKFFIKLNGKDSKILTLLLIIKGKSFGTSSK